VVHEEAQLHGVHDALAPLVSACLAKDPEERPSTLQLSMRLKEIAAREAQGLQHDARPPAQRERVESNRPTARYPERPERTERLERRTGGSSRPQAPARTGGGSRPQQPRTAGRTNGRQGNGTRPGVRTTSTGRRPANPRLLRQRITVFFVVTLIVALGIAAAQKL
jgi:hypothetical protein